MQDESSAVFSDDSDVDPTPPVYQLGPPDVMDVLDANLAVVRAFVIEADHRLVVTHIDECLIGPVADPDLGPRRWQPVVNEDQP